MMHIFGVNGRRYITVSSYNSHEKTVKHVQTNASCTPSECSK